MESKNYGNFLADKFIVVNKHKYFRKTYLFFLQVFMFFLLCGVLVEGTAWGYCFYKYSLPQASQIETQYKKSRAINQKIQEAGADLRQAEEENLKVLSFLTLVAKSKPAALSLRSLNMTKDNIQILGEGSVIPGSVGNFLAMYQPVRIFVMQAGAFFVLACLIAFMNRVKRNMAAKGKDTSKFGVGGCCTVNTAGAPVKINAEKKEEDK